MARKTPPPQQDHLEELFHELRTSRKGGQRAPRAVWLPVVFLLTFAGLGLLAVGAYYGGTRLLGLDAEETAGTNEEVVLSDLGPAPRIGEIAEWAIIDGYTPAADVIVLQVWRDTGCPGCVVHARLLNRSHFETDRAFDPLWIFSTADPDADFGDAAALAGEAKVDWAVGWDPTGRIGEIFPGDAAVSTYLIDGDGMLRYATTGAPQGVQLNRLVQNLTGTGPTTTTTAPGS